MKGLTTMDFALGVEKKLHFHRIAPYVWNAGNHGYNILIPLIEKITAMDAKKNQTTEGQSHLQILYAKSVLGN